MQPVDITGLGIICPGVYSYKDLKTFLYSGETCIRVHTGENFQNLSSNIGGGLANYDIQAKYHSILERVGKEKRANDSLRVLRKTLRRGPWSVKLSLLGLMEAALDCKFFQDGTPAHRQAVVVAGTLFTGNYLFDAMTQFATKNVEEDPFYVPMCFDSILASAAAEILGVSGPCFLSSSVCSSGNQALLNAQMLLNSGLTDRVFVIGAVHDFSVVEYESLIKMHAIPAGTFTDETAKYMSLPFDSERKGFIPTHGTGTVVLERDGLRPSFPKHGSLIGVASSNDMNSGLSAHSKGQIVALRLLFESIDIKPKDIDFVSTHATGTERGDLCELETLRDFFELENGIKTPKLTAPKAILGHCLSSSAIVEMMAGLVCLQEKRIHGHPSLHTLMETGGMNVVKENVHSESRFFLNNSFGFGGLNSCSVVGRTNV